MKENINTSIGNVNTSSRCSGNKERQPVDCINEVLISNETSFSELIRILCRKPEAIEAANREAEEKLREKREAERRMLYGDDYGMVFGEDKENMKKCDSRPRPFDLRKYESMVARMELPGGGYCEVFSNGYAVYDNGNRKCVIWVPDCGSTTYYFGLLKESEKEYLEQKKELSEDVLGPLPWYQALIIGGENRIEFNMAHPKSKGNSSDSDDPEEWENKGNHRWSCGTHFPNPEEAYLDKEEAEERRRRVREEVNQLRKTQKEAIELCYFEGLTQEEAAKKLGKAQSSVNGRIKSGKEALAKKLEKVI